jgi:hypothetical protein
VAKFERDSIGWQIDKLSHHWEEWLESNTNTIKPPDYEPPAVAMDWLLPFVYISAWLLLSVFLAWLGLIIYRLSRNYWLRQWIRATRRVAVPYSDRTVAEFLRTAQKLYQQGDYREACRHLYLALLQTLHDRQIVPQQLSRTDGEYRHVLAQKKAVPLQPCTTIINLHERLIFSDLTASPQDFDLCQTAFNQVIQQP